MRVAGVAKYLESLLRLGGQFSPRPELGSCAASLFCNIYYPCRATCPRTAVPGRAATSFEPHPEHRIRLPISGTAKVGPSSATSRADDIVAHMPATVAPAKDVDARLQNLAEPGGAPPRIFRLDVSALVLAHVGVPAIWDLWLTTEDKIEQKRTLSKTYNAQKACRTIRRMPGVAKLVGVKMRIIGGVGRSEFRAISCRRSTGRPQWSNFVGFCADR